MKRKVANKKNLMIVHPDLRFGGAERQIVNFISGIQKCNLCKPVLALYKIEGPLLEELSVDGELEIYGLKSHPFGTIGAFLRLVFLMKKLRIDVVYSFLVGPNLFCALAGRLLGIELIVWGNRISSFEYGEFGLKGNIADYLARQLSRHVDLIISNTEVGVRELQKKGIKAKKHIVIGNGIDVPHLESNDERRNIFRQEIGISLDSIVIGQVARLVSWKGYSVFLQAAAEFLRVNPVAQFVCVGDGATEFKMQLQTEGEHLGIDKHIFWLGNRSDVSTILGAIDIFTLTSTSGEGFSNALAEAMAAGLPVVVTDIGESRRIVGEFGIVVEPNNSKELVRAWQILVSSQIDRTTIGIRLRERVIERYSIESMVNQTAIAIGIKGD